MALFAMWGIRKVNGSACMERYVEIVDAVSIVGRADASDQKQKTSQSGGKPPDIVFLAVRPVTTEPNLS